MENLKKDILRFGKKNKIKLFLFNPMFRYMVIYRINQNLTKWNPFFLIFRIWHKNLSQKYSIQIPLRTKIGGGLRLGHFSGIVVNQKARIGDSCTIAHGVTIGWVSRGKLKGCPKIGNRVYIGANSVVIGNIEIGDDVLIAPLTYVNMNIPSKAVVSGNPCKIINYNSSSVYVQNPIY